MKFSLGDLHHRLWPLNSKLMAILRIIREWIAIIKYTEWIQNASNAQFDNYHIDCQYKWRKNESSNEEQKFIANIKLPGKNFTI